MTSDEAFGERWRRRMIDIGIVTHAMIAAISGSMIGIATANKMWWVAIMSGLIAIINIVAVAQL